MNNIKNIIDEKQILKLLYECWSIDSSSLWKKENPSCGQCGVTSLVINEYFGGEILKTRIGNRWHFYNRIEGKRFDFTKEQFKQTPNYMDLVSSREEVFSDTNFQQYNYLSKEFLRKLNKN